MMMKTPLIFRGPIGQRGISLVIVLVLLLVMTLLGLAVLRSTLLEERMTANLFDRSLSFQSAEAALREGEAIAATEPTPPAAGCAGGVCATPVPGDLERWRDPGFDGWISATSSVSDRSTPTVYFIEFMGEAPTWPGCDRMTPVPAQCLRPFYRVTARSADANRAEVILQSNFILQ